MVAIWFFGISRAFGYSLRGLIVGPLTSAFARPAMPRGCSTTGGSFFTKLNPGRNAASSHTNTKTAIDEIKLKPS